MTSADFASNRDNFCYRHPDRQSFVLCQRCLRTICGDCQTQGPVGVVCPECMKAQRKTQTPQQRRAGRAGGVLANTFGGRPPTVTTGIIGVTGLVGIAQMIPGVGSVVEQVLLFFAPFLYPELSGVSQPWRVVTALFVHGGILHFAMNMLALYVIGRSLERMLGAWRFLALYLIAGMGGSVAVALLAPLTPVVGASGAIFGLFGALLVIGRQLGADMRSILVILGLNLAIGFLPGTNISWQAHVGGLVVGALVGLIFVRTRTKQRQWMQWLLLAGVVVLLALVLVFAVPPLVWARLG